MFDHFPSKEDGSSCPKKNKNKLSIQLAKGFVGNLSKPPTIGYCKRRLRLSVDFLCSLFNVFVLEVYGSDTSLWPFVTLSFARGQRSGSRSNSKSLSLSEAILLG